MAIEMLFQREKCPLGIVAWRETHADDGPGPRHELVSSIGDMRSVYRQDRDSWQSPDPLGERAIADEFNVRSQSDVLPQIGFLHGHGRRRLRMQTLDRDIAL